MSELLKTNIAVNLIRESTSSVFRFFNDVISVEPSDYKYGKLYLKKDTANLVFVENFNYVFFKSNQNIKFTINGVGQLEGKAFLHAGELVSIEFTNDTDDDITVDYVACKVDDSTESDEL
jgi:hypothetical protein